jgi:choline dehydrogenase
VDDQSWTLDNLLPQYKKSIHFTPPGPSRAPNASTEYNPAAFEPQGGSLQVSYTNCAGPFSSWIEGSFNEIGISTTQDLNSGSLFGCQYCSSTIDPCTQSRDSSQNSFLNDADSRPNLHTYGAIRAKKIVFDGNKVGTGVQVETAFISYTIHANKEVIISAGAFQSPQLLMVSGIGPASTLQSFGIDVISDLAGVGQNMIDHVFFGTSYRVNVDTFTKLANDLLYTAAQFVGPYTIEKQGPLMSPVADFLGWEKVPDESVSFRLVRVGSLMVRMGC